MKASGKHRDKFEKGLINCGDHEWRPVRTVQNVAEVLGHGRAWRPV